MKRNFLLEFQTFVKNLAAASRGNAGVPPPPQTFVKNLAAASRGNAGVPPPPQNNIANYERDQFYLPIDKHPPILTRANSAVVKPRKPRRRPRPNQRKRPKPSKPLNRPKRPNPQRQPVPKPIKQAKQQSSTLSSQQQQKLAPVNIAKSKPQASHALQSGGSGNPGTSGTNSIGAASPSIVTSKGNGNNGQQFISLYSELKNVVGQMLSHIDSGKSAGSPSSSAKSSKISAASNAQVASAGSQANQASPAKPHSNPAKGSRGHSVAGQNMPASGFGPHAKVFGPSKQHGIVSSVTNKGSNSNGQGNTWGSLYAWASASLNGAHGAQKDTALQNSVSQQSAVSKPEVSTTLREMPPSGPTKHQPPVGQPHKQSASAIQQLNDNKIFKLQC